MSESTRKAQHPTMSPYPAPSPTPIATSLLPGFQQWMLRGKRMCKLAHPFAACPVDGTGRRCKGGG